MDGHHCTPCPESAHLARILRTLASVMMPHAPGVVDRLTFREEKQGRKVRTPADLEAQLAHLEDTGSGVRADSWHDGHGGRIWWDGE